MTSTRVQFENIVFEHLGEALFLKSSKKKLRKGKEAADSL